MAPGADGESRSLKWPGAAPTCDCCLDLDNDRCLAMGCDLMCCDCECHVWNKLVS